MKKTFYNTIFAILALLLISSLFIPSLTQAEEECPFDEKTWEDEASQQLAKERLKIYFFYGATCPHCAAEKKFLSQLAEEYPQIEIESYLNTNPKYQSLLRNLVSKHNAQKYLGLVPMTFVGNEFFLGYDNEEGIGQKIECSIKSQLYGLAHSISKKKPTSKDLDLPFIGKLDPEKYSLPILTIILGTLDGFNVCSLGALVFILGLVLALKSRHKILLFGGIFILTTAIIYGLLMIVWYQIFNKLCSYIDIMHLIVGGIALIGASYFARQFIKFQKEGVACSSAGSQTIGNLTSKLKETFQNSHNLLIIIGAILVFAAVITIIEFPCSAAVPVVYTGILAQAGLSKLTYLAYISGFVFLYMLDEIIVFAIAVSTMKLWLTSQKATKYITLAEAIILALLAFYYLFGWLI
jgi:thiol-disulfide isomerase/thioredoxin